LETDSKKDLAFEYYSLVTKYICVGNYPIATENFYKGIKVAETERERSEVARRMAETEKARGEELLLNILPAEVAEIDHCFSTFDHIVQKHGVEK
jgi:hypothetical protein